MSATGLGTGGRDDRSLGQLERCSRRVSERCSDRPESASGHAGELARALWQWYGSSTARTKGLTSKNGFCWLGPCVSRQ